MSSNAYPYILGTIQEITCYQDNCCQQILSLNTRSGPASVLLLPSTFVAGMEMMRPGMTIAAFYNPNAPVPLIYPPQYRATAITSVRENETVMLNYFNTNLAASDNSLVLIPSERTQVFTANGQPYRCSPGGNFLLVYYSAATRSIPPQTTPDRIIVFCQE